MQAVIADSILDLACSSWLFLVCSSGNEGENRLTDSAKQEQWFSVGACHLINGLPVRQKTEFDEKYKQKYYKDVDGKTVVYNDDFNKAVPVTPEDDAYEEKSSIVLKQNELKLAENRLRQEMLL